MRNSYQVIDTIGKSMIYGIGIDIVEVKRIQDAWIRLGRIFYSTILTDKEFAVLATELKKFHYVAKALAAKESFVKALGTGFSKDVTMQDIHLDHTPAGQPQIMYNEKVKSMLIEKGIYKVHCSLSDEQDYVVANVLLEF